MASSPPSSRPFCTAHDRFVRSPGKREAIRGLRNDLSTIAGRAQGALKDRSTDGVIHDRCCSAASRSASRASSSPSRHRTGDALAARKEAIDTLEQTVPLWKKEVYESGEEWIGSGS